VTENESHEAPVIHESWWMRALRTAGVPLLSVVLAMIIGSIVMIATGSDPIAAWGALLQGAFGGPRQIGETIMRSTPLIFAGLAVAFGFRANLFNIGADGQLILGMLAAAWLGIVVAGLPTVLGITIVFLGAALFGAAWAFIPALLKARVGAHEVITTMMFSWIALYFTSYLVTGPLADNSGIPQTQMLGQSVWLPTLDKYIPGIPPIRAHMGFVIALVLAFVVAWVLRRTTLGYEVRATGFNPFAAQNGGISVGWTTIRALCLSGALAGLAGASEVLGVQHRMFDQVSAGSGFGFTGIAVALLAKNDPIAVIFAAILFGALNAGAGTMQLEANVSQKIITIVQALVIFFVGAETIIAWLIKRRQKRALELKEATSGAE
jgi:general nucleoside transport system permease protein